MRLQRNRNKVEWKCVWNDKEKRDRNTPVENENGCEHIKVAKSRTRARHCIATWANMNSCWYGFVICQLIACVRALSYSHKMSLIESTPNPFRSIWNCRGISSTNDTVFPQVFFSFVHTVCILFLFFLQCIKKCLPFAIFVNVAGCLLLIHALIGVSFHIFFFFAFTTSFTFSWCIFFFLLLLSLSSL